MVRFLSIMLFWLLAGGAWTADIPPDIRIGKVNISALKWGKQKVEVEVINNTNDLKFIIIETQIQFSESYLTPSRTTRSSHYLEPLGHTTLLGKLDIPGNYGVANLKVTLYNVVDTLDPILPGQEMYTQPFVLRFRMPDAILPYLQEKITLPPRVEEHPYYDNEFSRIFLRLIGEGKSLEEIASMTESSAEFVNAEFQLMLYRKYVQKADSGYTLTFPFITVKEAEAEKEIADRTADKLASFIGERLKSYRPLLDSLVAVGVVTKDSNDFLSGATFLYHPYPVVAAFLLWYDLGQKFITRQAPLLLYDGTDFCNAANYFYMYAVQGGDFFIGSQFYALLWKGQSYQVIYADHPLSILCDENFLGPGAGAVAQNWRFDPADPVETYMLDTAAVKPMLGHLSEGADNILDSAYNDLKAMALGYNHESVSYGHRYWFWNLVATRTLKNLTESGAVTKSGNGAYKFESYRMN